MSIAVWTGEQLFTDTSVSFSQDSEKTTLRGGDKDYDASKLWVCINTHLKGRAVQAIAFTGQYGLMQELRMKDYTGGTGFELFDLEYWKKVNKRYESYSFLVVTTMGVFNIYSDPIKGTAIDMHSRASQLGGYLITGSGAELLERILPYLHLCQPKDVVAVASIFDKKTGGKVRIWKQTRQLCYTEELPSKWAAGSRVLKVVISQYWRATRLYHFFHQEVNTMSDKTTPKKDKGWSDKKR